MSATQLPKPGDRFRWCASGGVCTVVGVTDHNVFYEREDTSGCSAYPSTWLAEAFPIPPKPHVEPVQWGTVGTGGDYYSAGGEASARSLVEDSRRTLTKLDHGVLWLEVDGQWVRAFEDGAG